MDLSLFLADMESRFDQQRRDEHDEMLIEMLDAERATVSYAERLLATLHREIELTLRGGQRLKGRVGDVALQWIRLEGERDQHIIPLHAIVAAVGLGAPTTNADSPAYRVSIGHLLRGLGERHAALVIDHDAGQYSGVCRPLTLIILTSSWAVGIHGICGIRVHQPPSRSRCWECKNYPCTSLARVRKELACANTLLRGQSAR